eukprot:m.36654 g.36654  ORF g.36654 m.36654 type:complete len:290 (-) comp9168_c0_seq1:260-1129(-)
MASSQEYLIPYFAGAVSGISDTVFSHPLDTLKTRLQSRQVEGKRVDSGRLWTHPSFRKGLYDGINPALVRGVLSNSIFLGCNDTFRNILGVGQNTPAFSPSFLGAAVLGSFAEALLYTPLELSKIKLQVGQHKSTPNALRELVAKHGIRGSYLGFTAMLYGVMLGNVAFFTSYKLIVDGLERSGNKDISAKSAMIAGSAANILYFALGHPLDTVQSCIMTQRYAGELYSGTLDCTLKLVKSHGTKSLFRGIVPNVLQAIPGGAACMVTYELVMIMMDPSRSMDEFWKFF